MKSSEITLIALFASLTAIGAQIQLPIEIVPISLQTLFVLAAGGILGRKGALVMMVYLFIGLIGMPVFAGYKGGAGVLLGPTGGYIIGFIPAAYVTGFLTEKKKNMFLAMVTASFIVYLFGVPWLCFFVGSTKKAVLIGMIPFIPGDILKSFGASVVTKEVRRYYSFS
ncbi:MAG: biotin transporter BioY [Euryarchaeota archaeon]|nr:biotin transporter BioY [Euryarchaeota archaeon]